MILLVMTTIPTAVAVPNVWSAGRAAKRPPHWQVRYGAQSDGAVGSDTLDTRVTDAQRVRP